MWARRAERGRSTGSPRSRRFTNFWIAWTAITRCLEPVPRHCPEGYSSCHAHSQIDADGSAGSGPAAGGGGFRQDDIVPAPEYFGGRGLSEIARRLGEGGHQERR